MLIVMLLVTTGGHWALLQSFAWTTMLADHLQSESLAQAVEQTFDGRHLCPLCRAIRAAKKAQQKTELSISTQKIEFPPLATALVLHPPTAFQFLNAGNIFAESALRPPPVPPPRSIPV